MAKKIFAVIVLLVLLTVLFAGCNEENTDNIVNSDEETYYDPEYVKANSASFIESGETIIIEGYYDSIVEDGGIVKTSYQDPGSGTPVTGLKLDASNVANFSEKLIENTKLRFTGHLEYITPDNVYSGVVFIASEITDSW